MGGRVPSLLFLSQRSDSRRLVGPGGPAQAPLKGGEPVLAQAELPSDPL